MQFEETSMRPVTRDLFVAPLVLQLGDTSIRVADHEMRALFARARRLVDSSTPVLVRGETGVGKEIVARALHHMSPTPGPFIPVNCGGLPPALIESELFGHERGAFSGAVDAKVGLVEAAAGGTVLLDEIGEMPLGLQAQLLRLFDRNEIRRVGSVNVRHVKVRVVAATNRDLDAEVRAGRFREDLLFRLKGTTLMVPPLRDRPLDRV
jgi:transcriptional regulator with GAF, ATPase, and Fis domain